jgi:hypothetical protein
MAQWSSLCLMLCLIGSAEAQELSPGPLQETAASDIGYRTVAEVSVKARKSVAVSTVRDWTIIADAINKEAWSFAPPSYPAYPAVVRRSVRPRPEGGSEIHMSVLCEAAKEPFDNLVREFDAMGKRI